MKTGIYGGTFNPIHLGHLHILQEFIRRLSLDRVLLIPTRVPPHKQAESLAEAEDRLEMCRLAAGEITEAPALPIGAVPGRKKLYGRDPGRVKAGISWR